MLSSGALTQDELTNAIADSGSDLPCLADRSAIDTVSNFTTIAPSLSSAGVRWVEVATDAAHMRRALAVGRIVLGRHSIRVTPIVVRPRGSDPSPESLLRVGRDVLRALLAAIFGFEGRAFAALVHPRRAAGARAWCESGADEKLREAALKSLFTAALARSDG